MATTSSDAALSTAEIPGPDRYLPFYGLAFPPFRSTADPERLWLGNAHRTILDTLARAIRNDTGIAILTGDAGTGKTSLSRRLIAMLGPAGISVGRVSSPGAAPSDFFEAVLSACGVRRPVPDKETFATSMRDILAGAGTRGDKTLLVVDEAQGLSHDVLREVGDLSAAAAAAGHPLVILLIGETRLTAALLDDRHAALRARIAARCAVPPLGPDDVGAYVRHHLEAAGAVTEIFSPEAIRTIASLSRGAPGAINIIGDRALLVGRTRQARPITEAIAGECGRSPGSRSTSPAEVVKSSTPGASQRSRDKGRGRLYVTIAATALFVTGAPYLVWWLTGLGNNSAPIASDDASRLSFTPARKEAAPTPDVVALPASDPPAAVPLSHTDRVTLPERRAQVSGAPVEANAAIPARPAASRPRMVTPREIPEVRESPPARESSVIRENPATRQRPATRDSAAIRQSPAIRDSPAVRDSPVIRDGAAIREGVGPRPGPIPRADPVARRIAPPAPAAAPPAPSAAAPGRSTTPEAASQPRAPEGRTDAPDPSAVIDWLMKESPGRR